MTTILQEYRQIGDAIATDYSESWSIGIWFVIPFALTGLIVESAFRADFGQSLFLALFVGIFVAAAKVRSKALLLHERTDILALSRKLREQDGEVRKTATEAIKQLGSRGIPALIELLHNPSPTVSWNAAFALEQMEFEAVPALTEVLRESNSEVSRVAAFVLGQLGPTAVESVPGLIGTLRHPDAEMRWTAGHALGRIGREAIPALVSVIADPSNDARSGAVFAFGYIGSDAIPVLVSLVGNDPDNDLCSAAEFALRYIGGEAIPSLFDALRHRAIRHPESNIRSTAEIAVGRFLPEQSPASLWRTKKMGVHWRKISPPEVIEPLSILEGSTVLS